MTNNFAADMTVNQPTSIGGNIVQGNIGNGVTAQQGTSSATGGSLGVNVSLGLMNLPSRFGMGVEGLGLMNLSYVPNPQELEIQRYWA